MKPQPNFKVFVPALFEMGAMTLIYSLLIIYAVPAFIEPSHQVLALFMLTVLLMQSRQILKHELIKLHVERAKQQEQSADTTATNKSTDD